MNQRRRIRFRWLLPLAELVVCAGLLWPWGGFLIMQMRAVAHAHWPTVVSRPVFALKTSDAPATAEESRAETMAKARVWTPALLNFPAAFVGLARNAWVPRGMLPEFWRSISWPFVGAFFWYIAGRSIDALLSSRRRIPSPAIGWFAVTIASWVTVCALLLCLGFVLDPSVRAEFIYPWPLGSTSLCAVDFPLCHDYCGSSRTAALRTRACRRG